MSCDEIRWVNLPTTRDERGALTSIEAGTDVPFEIKRVFYIHDVKTDRGGHAHIDTDQVLVAPHGSLVVHARDRHASRDFTLSDPGKGLYIPRLVFVTMSNFSRGAVCLVFANTHYDKSKSLRSWEQYRDHIDNKVK